MLRPAIPLRPDRLHPPAFRRRFGDEILAIFDAAPEPSPLPPILDGLLSPRDSGRCVRNSGTPPGTRATTPDGVPSFNPRSLSPSHRRRVPWTGVVDARLLSDLVSRSSIAGSGFSTSVFPKFSSKGRSGCHRASESSASWSEPSANRPNRAVETEPAPAPPTTSASSNPQPILAPRAATRDPRSTAQPSQKVRSTPQLPSDTPVVPQQQIVPRRGAPPSTRECHSGCRRTTTRDRRSIREFEALLRLSRSPPRRWRRSFEAHEANGDNDNVSDGDAFASLLTTQMRDVSHDQHLMVLYSATGSSEAHSAQLRKSLPVTVTRWSAPIARLRRSPFSSKTSAM